MIDWLLSLLGHCAHRHYTFPQTDKAGATTIFCLDCGRRMPYSWEQMRVIRSR